jgi:hypothetical protein
MIQASSSGVGEPIVVMVPVPVRTGSEGIESPDAVGRRARNERAVGADEAHDIRLAEHEFGPLLRIVGVDRNVGGAEDQHREDRDVEGAATRGDADADPVATAHAGDREGDGGLRHEPQQLAIADRSVGVGQRGRLRMPVGRVAQDVDQGSGRRCALTALEESARGGGVGHEGLLGNLAPRTHAALEP